jgi:hypothetical protein
VRLRKGAEALAGVALDARSYDPAWDGLEKVYRKARRAFAVAYAEPDDEAFHEWRKAVQQHWRHMALIANAWPDAMKAREALAREL